MYNDAAMVLIFFTSAFVTAFAGFGFAMVSVPLLALLLPVKLAVALQFPYSMGLFMYQAWHYRYASNNVYRITVDAVLLLAAVILWLRA
jgi:uncharacterized membrane protein YfcA